VSGSSSTFSKLETLLRTTNLTATRFSALCSLCDIKGVSDASLNRAIQRRDFNNEVDLTVRSLVLRLEDLIARAEPFPISFVDPEHIKTLLDAIDLGIDLSTNTIPLYKNSVTAETTTIPAAQ
jgi:hypothetical protein